MKATFCWIGPWCSEHKKSGKMCTSDTFRGLCGVFLCCTYKLMETTFLLPWFLMNWTFKVMKNWPLEVNMHAAQPNKVRLGGVFFFIYFSPYSYLCQVTKGELFKVTMYTAQCTFKLKGNLLFSGWVLGELNIWGQ